jgi:RNA polymerase sigma-70 factor (ECF subfamily)
VPGPPAEGDPEEALPPRGLEETVTEYFDEFRTPLLRYLRSMGLPIQDSEEVVQEVFLALFEHLRSGKSRSNLRGWVFRVAHNRGLKRRQANGRHLRLVSGSESDLAMSCHDPRPDPEAQTARQQRRERALAILGTLSEQDRRCLGLRAEGLRYREIARVLGISLGGVALSLKRSLTALTPNDRE